MARASPKIDLASDKAAALALTPVSRETETRLDRYVALLLEWQAKTNLVAPSTLPQLWTRHISDSLQLLSLAPSAKTWIDLGSGGGAHLVFGGPSAPLSPFFVLPALLPSIIRYWQHHPALSYAFTGAYLGPSSQAPHHARDRPLPTSSRPTAT